MQLNSIKKRLPTREQVQANKYLRFLGDHFHDPNLWRFNRRSVARATGIGIFCAFLPMPFEMIPAAAGSVLWRANLPIALAWVWISNPITWIPLWGPPYLLGSWLLQEPGMDFSQLTLEVFAQHVAALWLGCIIAGAVIGGIGYLVIHGLWRLKIAQMWRHRRQRNHGRSFASKDRQSERS